MPTLIAILFGGTLAQIVALTFPSYLFLVPVQQYVNRATLQRNPNASSYRWSVGHSVVVGIGPFLGWGSTLAG